MEIDLSGKQALVTGGTSGIGAAIARALADCGCNVRATGLTAAEVDAFLNQPGESRRLAESLQASVLDVTDPGSVERIVGGLARLDILVNCAGMILRAGREFEIENFIRVVEVNLTGTMRICLAARPLLARQGGAIINTASMLSFFGSGVAPAYAASKGGIAQLTKSLAIAWAKEGIRVNAIAPGWINTPLTQSLVDDPRRSAAIVERTPLGRWGEPEDIGGVVAFLSSPAARFITGTVLPVDGGYLVS